MALITVQRINSLIGDKGEVYRNIHYEEFVDTGDSQPRQMSISECYFAVRGAALVLPHEECIHVCKRLPKTTVNDIQKHLQSMFFLLRAEDTLKMAVKLETAHPGRTRYLVVVNISTRLSQNNEESCILGIDCNEETTVGLVFPVWADTRIILDGDGGFSITSSGRHHIFKPVSVQAMWSSLQTLHKISGKARQNNYYSGGSSHAWVKFYEKQLKSDQSCLNEWNAMDDIIYKRPPSPDLKGKPSEQEATEQLIRAKLKEVMMSVDLNHVTSKFIRSKLEKELDMDLNEFKSFIDQEMLTILGQMDEPTKIFDYLYLGSEWNASNLDELKYKGITKILNVTREIDNFFPGMFDYYNIRVVDDDSTEMLKFWDKTFKYIRKAKEDGVKVLVHCKMGISRSASVVIAYIMKAYNWNLEKAMNFVKEKRSCIRPNESFLKQLEIYQGILDASKLRHLWRSKSETNIAAKENCFRKCKSDYGGPSKKITHYNTLKQQHLEITNKNNKQEIDLDNLGGLIFNVPGSVLRPKSWSPSDPEETWFAPIS